MMNNMATAPELLSNAVRSGDLVALDGLLNQYRETDLNVKTAEGFTLLMVAIQEASRPGGRGQYEEVVQLLVQVGCDVNAVDDRYGRTPSHWAVQYHQEDMLSALLVAGADASLPDYSGASPLLLAIQENSTTCVATILRFFPKEMLDFPDQEGRSPLLYAIFSGSVKMCGLLVDSGASVSTPDQVMGRTPFHWACLSGQREVVEYFAEREGCEVGAGDGEGRLPVHLAASSGRREALQVLLRTFGSAVLELVDVGGLTPLMYACVGSSEDTINYFLKKKVNVAAVDNEGKTCLHWAVEVGTPEAVLCVQLLCRKHPELMRSRDHADRTPLLWSCVQGTASNLSTLIDLGDDITVADSDQHSALHWAIVTGSPKCLSLLLARGCAVNSKDVRGASPLHYAAQNSRDLSESSLSDTQPTGSPQGILECLQLLLEGGAQVEATDNDGNTPFHWGIQSPNNFTALSYIVAAGIDQNRKNNDGQTALHLAAKQGLTENCQFLLEAVGEVGLEEDGEGQTPLFAAVEGGHFECAQYLLGIGSNVNHLNQEGRSAVHVAAGAGAVACVQLLASSGADLQLRTVHGALPMHEAAASGHTEVIEFLLVSGCDVNRKVSGGTALHYAASGGHLESAQLLIDSGVEVNALVGTSEETYASALDYAEASMNSDLTQLIKSHKGRTGESVARRAALALQKHFRRQRLRARRGKAQQQPQQQQGPSTSPPPASPPPPPPPVSPATTATTGTATPVPAAPLPSVPEDHPLTPPPQTRAAEGKETEKRDEPTEPAAPVEEAHQELKPAVAQQNKPDPALPSTPTLDRTRSSLQDIFDPPKPPSRPPSSVGFPSPTKPLKPPDYTGEPPPRNLKERQQSVLQRALGLFRRSPPKPRPTVDSAVGLYSAAALILMGGLVGGGLGDKTMKMADRVAHNRGDEVERERDENGARNLPDLVWEEPPAEPAPVPTPSPTPPRSPSPEPPPVQEDPLERRRRKAKAQLSLNRSVAFNVVNEMAKAQATQSRLQRQFNFKRVDDQLSEWRRKMRRKEVQSVERSEKMKSLNRERLLQANARAKIVRVAAEESLLEARRGNRDLEGTALELGYSRRPTVAQWLEQKKKKKKGQLQEEMVQWDRERYKRELAVTVTQTSAAKRAHKHLAWDRKKELQGRIRRLKAEESMLRSLRILEPFSGFEGRLRSTRAEKKPLFPKPPSSSDHAPSAVRPLKPALRTVATSSTAVLRESNYSDVMITPQGFVKTPPPSKPYAQPPTRRAAAFGEEKLWSYGEGVAQGKVTPTLSGLDQLSRSEHVRATGPRTTPRNRSLVFVAADQYRPPSTSTSTSTSTSRSKRKVHPSSPTPSEQGPSSSGLIRSASSGQGRTGHRTQHGRRLLTQSPAKSPAKSLTKSPPPRQPPPASSPGGVKLPGVPPLNTVQHHTLVSM